MLQNIVKQALLTVVLLGLMTRPAIGDHITKIAAVVNDSIITTYKLDRNVAEIAVQNPDYANLSAAEHKAFRLEVLNNMIEENLLQQRAEELGLNVSDDALNKAIDDVQQQNKLTRLQLIAALEQQGMSFEAYRNKMRNQILRLKLIGREVQGKIDVTGHEINRYYEEHIDDYTNPPYINLSHLMFLLPDNVTTGELAAIRAKAEKARKRLLMGDSVADLLVTYSDASGGDMGKLEATDLAPAFVDAVSDLQAGEISEIVTTPGSLFIFKMLERSNGDPKPLEVVRPEIEQILLKKNREEAFTKWQKDLRGKAYIDIRI